MKRLLLLVGACPISLKSRRGSGSQALAYTLRGEKAPDLLPGHIHSASFSNLAVPMVLVGVFLAIHFSRPGRSRTIIKFCAILLAIFAVTLHSVAGSFF